MKPRHEETCGNWGSSSARVLEHNGRQFKSPWPLVRLGGICAFPSCLGDSVLTACQSSLPG